MNKWTENLAKKNILRYCDLDSAGKTELTSFLDSRFPYSTYCRHLECHRKALENLKIQKEILKGAYQHYPPMIESSSISGEPRDIQEYAVMFTAGGDGERLRQSLVERGYKQEKLQSFTKATFPLPGFPDDFGTLQINLCVISNMLSENKISIPVIVSTGPGGSATSQIIPSVLRQNNNFGLKNLLIIKQDERLHLTNNEQIAYAFVNGNPLPVTHPDETGGPIMRLKKSFNDIEKSPLEELKEAGCRKLILLQGTSIYEPSLILKIACAAKKHDAIGIGIPRTSFPLNDPFGTYVLLEKGEKTKLHILEQDIRNETTIKLKDKNGIFFLPFNTGIYAFDLDLLEKYDLPDYATPPKMILPDIPKSPKIGYAATDIMPLADSPAILAVSNDCFAAIKQAEDLNALSEMGKRLGLDRTCKEVVCKMSES